MKSILILAGIITIGSNVSAQKVLPVADSTNLPQLQGKWYEIASIPKIGKKDCSCTTSEYAYRNGELLITNTCVAKDDGETEKREMIAKPVRGSNNSKLKVKRGIFGTRLWVLEIDPANQWVMLGHPNRKSLQILTREPSITENGYQELLKGLADKFSYDTSRIKRTTLTCPANN
ncbi:lipocalin family protein [Flavihumibacter sediminis]|nr:lipocalin family protein [Flavihumibacter sediminis]